MANVKSTENLWDFFQLHFVHRFLLFAIRYYSYEDCGKINFSLSAFPFFLTFLLRSRAAKIVIIKRIYIFSEK